MTTQQLLEKLRKSDCDFAQLSGDFSSIETFVANYVGKNYGGYNLFINNCLQYVKNALSYTGNVNEHWMIIPALYKPAVAKENSKKSKSQSVFRSGIGGSPLMYNCDSINPLSILIGRYSI